MALNLIELIKASGGAGSSGQTFRNNVTGAGNGVKMSDYRVTAISASGWYPPDDVAHGASNNLYAPTGYDMPPLTLTLTRGPKAVPPFQRVDSSAFTVTGYSVSGGGGLSITPLSTDTYDNGATFQMNVRVLPNLRGSPTFSTSQTFFLYQEGWYWTMLVGTQGTAGSYSTINLLVGYDPDSANFNPQVYVGSGGYQGYQFTIYDRTWTENDFEFRWYAYADANPNNPSDPYPYTTGLTYAVVEPVAQTTYTVWRWYRYVASNTWSLAGFSSYYYAGSGGGGGGQDE